MDGYFLDSSVSYMIFESLNLFYIVIMCSLKNRGHSAGLCCKPELTR